MQKLQHKKLKLIDGEAEADVLKSLFYKYGYTDSQIYEYIQNYRSSHMKGLII